MGPGAPERLVEQETAAEGDLVKIAGSARTHWACRRFVGLVGRLHGKDEYSGWWVEFQGHSKALFHCTAEGGHQLAYAVAADIDAARRVNLSEQALAVSVCVCVCVCVCVWNECVFRCVHACNPGISQAEEAADARKTLVLDKSLSSPREAELGA